MEPQTTKQPPNRPNPLVLGIATARMLGERRFPDALWACGGVELRADGLPVEDIVAAVKDFTEEKTRRAFKGPVVFTLRLERDGGAWKNAEASAREAVWRALPMGSCDLVDLEVEEIDRIDPAVPRLLRDLGARILLSHHAFVPEGPEQWSGFLEAMRAHAPEGVKFAVQVDPHDVAALIEFARKVAREYPTSCVLGMGAHGQVTRFLGPLVGCPITYGFLGQGPVAPGQLDAETLGALIERGSEDFPGPDAPGAVLEAWAKEHLEKASKVRVA